MNAIPRPDVAASIESPVRFDSDFDLTIDGRAVAAEDTFTVVNPATEDTIAVVADTTREQLDSAVAAARNAFPGWRATPLEERQALVRALGARLQALLPEFAALLTREQGKPLADATAEIGVSAYWLNEIAGYSPMTTVISEDEIKRVETRHVPVGVVGAISPWNFPLLLAIWKVAPALVAGNTLVLKPSPFTPLTVLKFGEIARDILPPGVLNVVVGGDRLGPWITEHADIDKIAFTGSTQTGKAIMRSASVNLKRITLELGGNDPAIVMPDADVEALAPRLFWAAFSNNAQFCLASKRMYVHEASYDRLAAALVAYARTIKVGNGAEDGVRLGPVQNRVQYQRVRKLIEDAQAAGTRFLIGGEVPEGRGYFIPVAIADNPPDDSPLVTEEAFGPVLPLLKYRDIDEVLARANQSEYGLGASVWGEDVEAAVAVGNRIEAGTIWVNTIHELLPSYPFGGHKQSGIGVENGLEGLLEYTNPQTVVIHRKAATSI